MSKKRNKDYMALQNAWNICVMRYLATNDRDERYFIMNDFRDCLVDIVPEIKKETNETVEVVDKKDKDNKRLHKKYTDWEDNEWKQKCNTELTIWIRSNGFAAHIEKNRINEMNDIKRDLNPLRFTKILQVIQDSGIGLGQGKERETYDLSGYMGESTQ